MSAKNTAKINLFKNIIKENREFVVFDLETTGLSPLRGDKIIEIGAVRILDDKIIEKYSRLINPECRLTGDIINLTGIDNSMLQGQPLYNDILPEFKDFIEDLPLVAHNSNFDVKFIQHYLEKMNFTLQNQSVDTIPLLKDLYPNLENYKLGTVHRFFEFDSFNHHRAFDDAKITAQIFMKIQDGYGVMGTGKCKQEVKIFSDEKLEQLRQKYLKDFNF